MYELTQTHHWRSCENIPSSHWSLSVWDESEESKCRKRVLKMALTAQISKSQGTLLLRVPRLQRDSSSTRHWGRVMPWRWVRLRSYNKTSMATNQRKICQKWRNTFNWSVAVAVQNSSSASAVCYMVDWLQHCSNGDVQSGSSWWCWYVPMQRYTALAHKGRYFDWVQGSCDKKKIHVHF